MRPKAINVEVIDNFEIIIKFDNGEKRKLDVKPYFKFRKFEELKEKGEFKKVMIKGLSIEWENGSDICPDELYNNSVKI